MTGTKHYWQAINMYGVNQWCAVVNTFPVTVEQAEDGTITAHLFDFEIETRVQMGREFTSPVDAMRYIEDVAEGWLD